MGGDSVLKIEIQNPKEIEKFMLSLSGGMREVASRATADMILAASGYAKTQATIAPLRRTRLYWGSIHAEIKKDKGFVVNGLIASNVKYAPWLETGTRPHKIFSKNGKAFNHPGTRAYHVLGDAAKKAVGKSQLFVNDAMKYFKAKS